MLVNFYTLLCVRKYPYNSRRRRLTAIPIHVRCYVLVYTVLQKGTCGVFTHACGHSNRKPD
jgi:hypothetical protein